MKREAGDIIAFHVHIYTFLTFTHMHRISLLLIILFMAGSASGQQITPITIGHTITVHSKVLGQDRSLNIYLPPGYSESDTTHYPVVYLLDGGMDEDFLHIVGLYQFNTFPWVDRAPASIIVGIVNTDRKHDFTLPTSYAAEKRLLPTSGHSAQFISFMKRELQPYIRGRYRTTPDRTIIGESLGGLLATEILLKRPELFDRYIIISPSLWWNDGSLLRHAAKTLQGVTAHKDIYIGVGKEGPTPGAKPHVMEVDANLLVEKVTKMANPALHLTFDYLPDENHATIGHHAALNAMKVVYRK